MQSDRRTVQPGAVQQPVRCTLLPRVWQARTQALGRPQAGQRAGIQCGLGVCAARERHGAGQEAVRHHDVALCRARHRAAPAWTAKGDMGGETKGHCRRCSTPAAALPAAQPCPSGTHAAARHTHYWFLQYIRRVPARQQRRREAAHQAAVAAAAAAASAAAAVAGPPVAPAASLQMHRETHASEPKGALVSMLSGPTPRPVAGPSQPCCIASSLPAP